MAARSRIFSPAQLLPRCLSRGRALISPGDASPFFSLVFSEADHLAAVPCALWGGRLLPFPGPSLPVLSPPTCSTWKTLTSLLASCFETLPKPLPSEGVSDPLTCLLHSHSTSRYTTLLVEHAQGFDFICLLAHTKSKPSGRERVSVMPVPQ